MTEQLNQEIAEIENSTKKSLVHPLDIAMEGNGANDATMESQNYSLPSKTADWFDMDSIADIERQSLPEFFRGVYPSKTPSTYKEYRDFMIKLYRTNPQTYITATSKSLSPLLSLLTYTHTYPPLNYSLQTTPFWRCLRHSSCPCLS